MVSLIFKKFSPFFFLVRIFFSFCQQTMSTRVYMTPPPYCGQNLVFELHFFHSVEKKVILNRVRKKRKEIRPLHCLKAKIFIFFVPIFLKKTSLYTLLTITEFWWETDKLNFIYIEKYFVSYFFMLENFFYPLQTEIKNKETTQGIKFST